MLWLGRISSRSLTHVFTTDSEHTWLSLSPATSSKELCLEWVEGRNTGRAVFFDQELCQRPSQDANVGTAMRRSPQWRSSQRGLCRSSRQHVLHEWSLLARPTIWNTPEHHPAALGHPSDLQVYPQRNTSMRAHRDLNNAPGSSNVVLPCSSFAGGGLWLQSTTGHCPSLDGTMYGSVQNLPLSGVTFDPHQWHETRPWRGHRITIAIYTARPWLISAPNTPAH